MASVFANVYKLSGGNSVFANVYQLQQSTVPGQSGWMTKTATRHFVAAENKRLFRCEPQTRLWIAKVNNE